MLSLSLILFFFCPSLHCLSLAESQASALRINVNCCCIWQLSLRSHINSDALTETRIYSDRDADSRVRASIQDYLGSLHCIVS